MFNPILLIYQMIQYILSKILSPEPPPPHAELSRPRIAIIGAGITGVSAAAHCVGHGFDVTMFEAGGREELGGIWSRVNDTSGLQIHGVMYRFHPRVQWQSGYPSRRQILDAVEDVFKAYLLEDKTKFHTRVERVWQDGDGKWVLNNRGYGMFEGIIAAVGTCGEPKSVKIPNQDRFQGEIHHSSKLDGTDAKGKHIVIIGGGASAVEALEFATAKQAEKVTILARSDKWIIPRNLFVDMLLALNIFGQEIYLSWIPEFLLRRLFYRDLDDIAPSHNGIFTETPMVNSDVLDKIRDGSAEWLRGDIENFTENGIQFNKREKGVKQGGPGESIHVEADMVIMATGYERPKLDFLPSSCFDKPYNPPNWYLQTFPPPCPSVSCINCTYINGIGSVGNFHIGIYTRILLMFLVDPLTRPQEWLMKRWIDMTRLLKYGSPTPAFDFFTYTELIWWYCFCVAINPFRWKWALFVFFGIGAGMPLAVVQREEKIREFMAKREGKAGRTKA